MGLRVAVFASGGGSNFQALVERAHQYRVVLLVCNRPQSGVLKRAKQLDIPSHILSPRILGSEVSYVDTVLDLLDKENIDLIALAGYLLKVPSKIIKTFQGRILNIHPSLLPRFGGKGFYGSRVHKAVLEARETVSGATVHFVDEDYDTGPILLQKQVPVHTDDTPDSLAARVLKVEHQIYPEAIRLIAQERVHIQGHHVTIHPHTDDH